MGILVACPYTSGTLGLVRPSRQSLTVFLPLPLCATEDAIKLLSTGAVQRLDADAELQTQSHIEDWMETARVRHALERLAAVHNGQSVRPSVCGRLTKALRVAPVDQLHVISRQSAGYLSQQTLR